MAIRKLQNEGETLTMTVGSCEAVEGQYGEQVKFVAQENGDILYLPRESADRQLDRLGLDYQTAVGEALTFSRDHNPKKGAKPYWGISVAGPRSAPSRRIPPPSGAPPQGVSLGSLPFDDEDDSRVGMSAPPDAPLVGDEPALTPREQQMGERQAEFVDFYLNTYAHLLHGMSGLHAKSHIPLDASAIQAATATCVIQMDKRGLLR